MCAPLFSRPPASSNHFSPLILPPLTHRQHLQYELSVSRDNFYLCLRATEKKNKKSLFFF